MNHLGVDWRANQAYTPMPLLNQMLHADVAALRVIAEDFAALGFRQVAVDQNIRHLQGLQFIEEAGAHHRRVDNHAVNPLAQQHFDIGSFPTLVLFRIANDGSIAVLKQLLFNCHSQAAVEGVVNQRNDDAHKHRALDFETARQRTWMITQSVHRVLDLLGQFLADAIAAVDDP